MVGVTRKIPPPRFLEIKHYVNEDGQKPPASGHLHSHNVLFPYLGCAMTNCTAAFRFNLLFKRIALTMIAPMASGPRQKMPRPKVNIMPMIRIGQYSTKL